MNTQSKPIQGFKVYGVVSSADRARDVAASIRRIACAVVILSPFVAAFVVAFGGAL